MQTTPGYGPQLNLNYGSWALNLQLSDSYHTARANVLAYLLTYNFNADGSDNGILFGQTNLGHTGNPGASRAGVGMGFSEANSGLIGAGLHAPWQRGANENTNGLLRQYLPKGTSLAALSQDDLNKIAKLLNNRPRKALGFETPNEKLRTLIANNANISDIIIQGVRYGT